MYKLDPSLKKQIGKRFKKFREAIGKTQTQLAGELSVYQSSITNIEVGKTFPNLKYLSYFHENYKLNINWLLSNQGNIFLAHDDRISTAASLLSCHIEKDDPLYKKYIELMDLMQVPIIEQLILAKLVELKVIAREEITQSQAELQKEKKKSA